MLRKPNKLNQFFSELERRKVYKAAIAYGISAWVIAQIAGLVSDSFELPSWVMKLLIILLFFQCMILLGMNQDLKLFCAK